MRKDSQQKLVEAFPLLYADIVEGKTKQESCMAWGLTCGQGWFDIIWRMSEKLEQLIRVQAEPHARAAQIKEKFATLRVYLHNGTPEMHAIVDEAEEESARTCEACGKAGHECSPSGYWMFTLCEACEAEAKRRHEQNASPIFPGE